MQPNRLLKRGVRRLGTGLAIEGRLHVVEGVRVDCDWRVRVVQRHVCAKKRMKRSTMTTSEHSSFSCHRQLIHQWILSHSEK